MKSHQMRKWTMGNTVGNPSRLEKVIKRKKPKGKKRLRYQ